MKLKDKPQIAVSKMGPLLFIHAGQGFACNTHRTRVGHIQASQNVQQGTFTRSTLTSNGHQFSFRNAQIQALENIYRTITFLYFATINHNAWRTDQS